MQTVDFGRTADDYLRHREAPPEALFARLAALGVGRSGQRLVDVGTGTGNFALAFAARGCDVTGVDVSASLLDVARRRAAELGLEVAWVERPAEDTGLAAGSFDAVVAAQCWHWFDRDRAAQEASRLLARGGRVVITHFDWVTLPGNIIDATMAIVMRVRAHLPPPKSLLFGREGLYGEWLRDLGAAGFVGMETFSFDVEVAFTHAAWRGRMRASALLGASLGDDLVAAVDEGIGAMLAGRFPEVVGVPHRVFAVVATRGE